MDRQTLYFKATPFWVGGAAMLDFRGNGPDTFQGTYEIQRVCTSGINAGETEIVVPAGTQIFPLFLDQGDGMRGSQTITGPLPPGIYTYQVSAMIRGTQLSVKSLPVTLGKTIKVIPDGMHDVFVRALHGALRTVSMPAGMYEPAVFNAMPVGNLPPLPFVSVNEEMIQQDDVPIGQDAMALAENNTVTLNAMARRVWRISIFSVSAEERDFLRDYLAAVLRVLAIDLFQPLGRANTHKFQAVSYSTAKDGEVPGFFGCDIMYDTSGLYNTVLQTSYGVIESISATVTSDLSE